MKQSLWQARTQRRLALARCHAARADVHAAVDQAIGAYQAHPLPVLAGAAGVGFVLARLEVGRGFVRTGMRIAAGPGWRLVRQYFPI